LDPDQDQPWRLASGELAVALLSTLQLSDGDLVDELAEKRAATAWLRKHRPTKGVNDAVFTDLVLLREMLRGLLTAVIDGERPQPKAMGAVNDLAARAPVTVVARQGVRGAVRVEVTSQGTPVDALLAEIARSGLVLLVPPERERLGLCRAPGCILFFLKRHPRQQWCSNSCGNRARVARHYNRHGSL
jgi:predicted RNA-binding Zn ribbon-like protein